MKKGKSKKNSLISKVDFFMISYVFQMIISYVALFKIDKLTQTVIDSAESLKNVYDEATYNMMIESYTGISGFIMIMLMVSLCCFFAIIGFVYVGDHKQDKHKKALIILSAVSLFLASGLLSPWYSIFALITLSCSIAIKSDKITKEEKLALKKKNEIKVFKAHKVTKDVIIKSIAMIVIYLIVMFVPLPSFLNKVNPYILSIFYYGFLIALAIGLFYKEYKQMWAAFKKKLGPGIKYILANYGKMLLIFLPVSLLSIIIFGQSANEETLNQMNGLYVLILSVFYAPLVEETVFRGALRKLIKNDKAYIIISGLVFGLVHTIGQEPNLLLMIGKSLPYAVIGGYLARMYVKNGNMMYNMGVHAANNFVACILSLITGL